MAEALDRAPSTEPLDTMVELLAGLDSGAGEDGRAFYDRFCEAMCRLTSMERAGLLLYEEARRIVVPAGSYGFATELVGEVHGTLEETPVAQRALAEDRVLVIAPGELAGQVPDRYAALPGISALTCTPVSAGGRWLGVVFADRGGKPFEPTDRELHTMWTLGKTAALAASARNAATQHERTRLLAERVDLAREVHERVMQRLFGVSLVLGAETDLTPAERRRCADEIQAAVSDLRHALARPVVPRPDTGATLRQELERLGSSYEGPPLDVDWDPAVEVPPQLEQLSQSVLAEALRNAHKHADPSHVGVRIGTQDGTFVLEVVNDGVDGSRRGPGAGMGLRLAALDALQSGGVVDFGPGDSERDWRVRLVVPLGVET